MNGKTCKVCGQYKPYAEFYRAKTRDGRDGTCCDCRRNGMRQHYCDNKAAYRERAEWAQRFTLYGLTRQAYEDLFCEQDGQCACCGDSMEFTGRHTHVDHDHTCCAGQKTCGKCVRGLLCSACNLMLGYAKDSDVRLLAGIDYIQRWRERRE